MHQPLPNNRAFTLVELSIVLLIIGLIIGGIVAGTSLIQQAKLRTIINERTIYQTAYNTFILSYNALPGDMLNAKSYWPTQQNGNGNGIIELTWGSSNSESIYFWGHLSNSGVINGNYTGIGTGPISGTVDYELIGTNVPASKYGSGAGWGIFNNYWGWAFWNQTDNMNYLILGASGASNSSMLSNPVLSSTDAYNLDIKLDDGMPSSGTVVAASYAFEYTNLNCRSAHALGATYVLTSSGPQCFMGFMIR